MPGSERMSQIYPESYSENSAAAPVAELKVLVDNIAPTVNVVAALQVAAAIQYLCDAGSNQGLIFDSELSIPVALLI